MKITKITKTLNKTDLSLSGSHGKDVTIGRKYASKIKDFFGSIDTYVEFVDRRNDHNKIMIKYADYTKNKKTPNDRITPTNQYCKKYNLQPGDKLVFEKWEQNNQVDYYIDCVKNEYKVVFQGETKNVCSVLNLERLMAYLKAFNNFQGSETDCITNIDIEKVKYEQTQCELSIINLENSTCDLLIDGESLFAKKGSGLTYEFICKGGEEQVSEINLWEFNETEWED